MTKRKQAPPRTYDTFAGESPSDSAGPMNDSPTSYHRGDSDKSRSAAAEAQRLGSTGSWADQFSSRTSATAMTSSETTVDGDGADARGVQYPRLPHEADPSDPPPLYTPSASTVSPSTPSSPVAARVAPVSEPVSAPVNVTSPLNPSASGSQPRGRRQSFCPYAGDNDEDDDPAASSLPEPVHHPYQYHPVQNPPDPTSSIAQKSSKRKWCMSRRARSRGIGHRWDRKRRAHRFKRMCWFTFALLACLWLMLPGLCKSFSDKRNSQLPNIGSQPEDKPGNQFPIPRREYRQHETSHSISGTYQLYDLLDLSTTSGSITITVDIQAGDKPAVLRLSTTSGSVNVRMVPSSSGTGWFFWKRSKDDTNVEEKVKNLGRVLKTEISAKSGSVSGNIIHGYGGSSDISTNSGSISISVYPVGVSENDPLSTLSTKTGSGSQDVKVFSPSSLLGHPTSNSSSVRSIQAFHTATGSGSINIRYPDEWEGQLHAALKGSGSLQATGSGLQVQKQGRRELFGWKGEQPEDGQVVEITGMGSGSVQFRC